MPTYDYLCQNCGHRFEEFQSIVAEAIKVCPQCDGNVKRLINGGIGLIFKGSGFYLTDYARPKGSGESQNTGSAKDSAQKTESGKTATEKKKAKKETSN